MIEQDWNYFGPLPTVPVLTVFAANILLSIYSIIAPEQLSVFTDNICDAFVSSCFSANFHVDKLVLESAGYHTYATGFSALRRIGMIAVLMSTSALVIVGVFFGRVWRPANMLLVNIGTLLLSAYLLFIPDWYLAADGDFSGTNRPYYGSIVIGIGHGFASAAAASIVIYYVRIVIPQRKSGNRDG